MPKKPVFKELLVLSTIVFVCLLYKLVFVPIIAGNSALDINLHDTYYISSLPSVLWITIPFTCFVVYLFRAIAARFTNTTVLVILIVSTLCMIAWLSILAQFYNSYYFTEMTKQFAEEAQNTAPVKGLFYGGDRSVLMAQNYKVAILQGILILFIGFIGVRIGMNLRRPDGDKSN